MWQSTNTLTSEFAGAPSESCAQTLFVLGSGNVFAILIGDCRDMHPETAAHCRCRSVKHFSNFDSNLGPHPDEQRAMHELQVLFNTGNHNSMSRLARLET
jgi:hypothetical protein